MSYSEGPHIERDVTQIAETQQPPLIVNAGEQIPVVVPRAQVPVGRVRQARTSRFEPAAVITVGFGIVLLLLGLLAVTRAGFDGPLSDPVVEVLGFTHTATLGLIEVGAGLLLMIAGFANSRGAGMFFGTSLAIAGFVGAVQEESFRTSLAIESSLGWWMVVIGLVVVAVNALLPSLTRRSTVYEQV